MGNNTNKTRNIPYKPNFNKTPANIIDPPVGASTWASGNQLCTGYIGTFTAKATKNKNHKTNWYSLGNIIYCKIWIFNSPIYKYNHKIPKIINNDPTNVKKKK